MGRLALPFLLALFLAGCTAPGLPDGEGPAALEESEPSSSSPTEVVLTASVDIPAAVGLSMPDGSHGSTGVSPFPVEFDIERDAPSEVTFTAYWNATSPASQTLYLRFGNETKGWKVEGSSPLAI